MQRILSALAIAGILALLGSCGGGASTTPAPNNGGTGGPAGDKPVMQVSPATVVGSRESSVVPGQLSLQTTATDAQLAGTLAKLGFHQLYRNGQFVTVQVPSGVNLDAAAAALNKEYDVFRANKINVINTPAIHSRHPHLLKSSSHVTLDPMNGETFQAIGYDGTAFNLFIWFGQGWPLNSMSFGGAWDVATDATVSAVPVRIAIIDAGFADYSATVAGGPEDIDPAILDTAQSGSVDAAGTFTPGLAAAAWTTAAVDIDPPNGIFAIQPLRDTGGEIFTILANSQDSRTLRANDFDGNTTVEATEMWSEGIGGLNPNATYILIKTGTAAGPSWSFNDNEIAASIDHAVAAGANIIVLGMAGAGPVGANVSASIAAARAADALVIAPGGDGLRAAAGPAG
jgi:hypothetical protein